MKQYAVTATVVSVSSKGWETTHQIPTFRLSADVLGIVSEEHAERIAHNILDPLGSLNGSCSPYKAVHITAVEI